MQKLASQIAGIGFVISLLTLPGFANAAIPPLRPGAQEGLVTPVVVCPGGITARCQRRPTCKTGMVAVCLCSVEAPRGTGRYVCCRWKCSGGPF
jgi:hypothetical protein